MKNALETIPEQMWRRLNKLDLDELIPPKWTIIVNETGVQVITVILFFGVGGTERPNRFRIGWMGEYFYAKIFYTKCFYAETFLRRLWRKISVN